MQEISGVPAKRRIRLTVRTLGFQPGKKSSILLCATSLLIMQIIIKGINFIISIHMCWLFRFDKIEKDVVHLAQ